MKEWEKLFDSVALARARAVDSSRVVFTRRDSARVDAAILGTERTEVSIIYRQNVPAIMRCQCPKAKSGRKCEHMAAVLYQLDGEEQGSRELPEKMTESNNIGRIQAAWDKAVAPAALKESAKEAGTQVSGADAQEAFVQEQPDAERLAAEEAEKQAKKEAVEKKIAERKALKAAQKAERKRRRAEAEEAQKRARQEEAARKEEELRKQQEELARRQAEESERRRKEEAMRKEQEEEAARRKEEKVKAAIAKKQAEGKQPQYQYFHMDAIQKQLKISPENLEKGYKLAETNKVQLEKVYTGYSDYSDDMVAQVNASVDYRNRSFSVMLVFDRDNVIRTECGCSECRGNYYWTSRKSNCAFMAAVVRLTQQYLDCQEVGDATDKNGAMILTDFQRDHTNRIVADATVQEESLTLEPRLIHKRDDLRLSFKIGEGKLYVIKDLIDFCRQVRNSESVTYGTSTRLNHNINNFTPKARQWYEFISKVVQEEEDLLNRLDDMHFYYYQNKRKCPDFGLYGWRLEQFCEILGEGSIAFEDKAGLKNEKARLTCREGRPDMTMQIQKSTLGKKKEFDGIAVSCSMPEFYQGTEHAYYLKNNILHKTDISVINKIKPLLDRTSNGELYFQVGRNKLTDFYYTVLPQLTDMFTIMEEDSDEIHQYLPPEVEFIFYLDSVNHDIVCHVAARYGDRECSIMDSVPDDVYAARYESFRLEGREREIFFLTKQLFPYVDKEKDIFYCNQEEDAIYEVLSRGVESLAELGEVRCTNAFKSLNIVKKMQLTVGVSVASGLLDLTVETEGVSRAELLDVLKGYKLHKKYYRLKNGDFINLDDENLQTLKELMDTMHLPPKEFIKGKVHLPMYRTLYLDKLLEEKEGLYTSRDHTFRSMVKNFKTISDADYEVPSGLERVLRSYQKTGFQWLKTLESCQFGGILADDMGLGKTLQAIAFLLSAKEKGVTALVVAPASLVFNWGEEFERFAPEMKVQIITGDQQERQKKIEEYQKYDVSVTSYDLLRRDISYYEDKEFTYEIIDEAQYIKNHTTAAAKAVKVIQSRMRIALTGTPIENRLSELWSIFDFLMPGFLYSYEVFKKEIEAPVVKYDDKEAMARLQRMTGPFIMRRLKSDVLKDLPDKLEEVHYVRFNTAQQTAYDAQVVHMQELLAGQDEEDFNKNRIKVLAELTRLRQICCDPNLCFDNYQGESAKLDACIELIQSAIDGGHKLLLFSQFTSMLELIRNRLDQEGIAYYVITGEVSKEKRLRLVKSFNEDTVPVFLISLKAGGVGLNLTGADVVIHYDPWWNAAAQNQATDRAHRIGQTKKVTVYKLIAGHTIEEKILKLQESKRDLAEQVMNGELGQLGSMSKEELLELLRA